MNPIFNQEVIDTTLEFYETRERWHQILEFRKIRDQFTGIDNLFFGDSIIEGGLLHEFFPGHGILNRGIGGDNADGLYYRLQDDVLGYSPKQVFISIGINRIEDPDSTVKIQELARIIQEHGIKVVICSILPLRYPDQWDRFKFQDKIVSNNLKLKQWAKNNSADFIDYHPAMKDDSGQLAAEYAREDGTHLTFAGYCRMSEVLSPSLIPSSSR